MSPSNTSSDSLQLENDPEIIENDPDSTIDDTRPIVNVPRKSVGETETTALNHHQLTNGKELTENLHNVPSYGTLFNITRCAECLSNVAHLQHRENQNPTSETSDAASNIAFLNCVKNCSQGCDKERLSTDEIAAQKRGKSEERFPKMFSSFYVESDSEESHLSTSDLDRSRLSQMSFSSGTSIGAASSASANSCQSSASVMSNSSGESAGRLAHLKLGRTGTLVESHPGEERGVSGSGENNDSCAPCQGGGVVIPTTVVVNGSETGSNVNGSETGSNVGQNSLPVSRQSSSSTLDKFGERLISEDFGRNGGDFQKVKCDSDSVRDGESHTEVQAQGQCLQKRFQFGILVNDRDYSTKL